MALQFAQRGYVLETGTVVLEGPSKELLENRDVKKAYRSSFNTTRLGLPVVFVIGNPVLILKDVESH